MGLDLSVVMPVFNAELFIKEAIDSILNQTFVNFEFIIVNDGSTDNSLDIIKTYHDERIILINQNNQGLSKSLNNGIAIAKGKYIARMDADDISLPTRFEKQLKFLNENKNCILLGSNIYIIDVKGNILDETNLLLKNSELKKMLPNINFMHSSIIFLKSSFYLAGQYPLKIPKYFEDKILWNKMANYGEIANLEEKLVKYRLNPGSIFNLSNNQIQKLKVISNQIIKNNYLISKHDENEIIKITKTSNNKRKANYYYRLGYSYKKNKKPLKSIFYLIISSFYNPFDIATTKVLLSFFLPKTFKSTVKKYLTK